MKESYVQVYTGNGKGKTTAAVGLAVRAAGRGLSVKFIQFLKGRDTGEMHVLKTLSSVEFARVSECKKFFHVTSDNEKEVLRDEVEAFLQKIHSWCGEADVIILDEALGAITNGILTEDEVIDIIESCGGSEIVLTGRGLTQRVAERAHLITEMKDLKHYMDIGVSARRGIEF